MGISLTETFVTSAPKDALLVPLIIIVPPVLRLMCFQVNLVLFPVSSPAGPVSKTLPRLACPASMGTSWRAQVVCWMYHAMILPPAQGALPHTTSHRRENAHLALSTVEPARIKCAVSVWKGLTCSHKSVWKRGHTVSKATNSSASRLIRTQG